MTPEQLASKLLRAAREHPPGCIRYHRATGARMIVAEYLIDANGSVLLSMETGAESYTKVLPLCLSVERVHVEAGEEWKNGEEKAGS